ncbi:MAG: hypothetical protein ACFFCQ_11570, partial [Promethearchaeota archaeon]
MEHQILDLRTDPTLLPCGRSDHPSLIQGARDTAINDLRELFRKDLLRAKILVNPQGNPCGVIFYSLVENSLYNLTGEGILHLLCLEVRESERLQRFGEKLIHAAINDYPASIVQGISTFSYGEYWMPKSYFKKLGFRVTHQEGLLTLQFRPLVKNISPPSLLKVKIPPYEDP